jgi:regulatory protein
MEAKELSPERLEKRARNVLLHQLARSMKTEEQLRQILIKREIPSEIAEPILARFVEVQLIDDLVFAKAFVNSRIAAGGKSRAAIARELRTKGVSEQHAAMALEQLDSEKEQSLADALALKRYGQLSKLDSDVRYRRLSGFLARRGFSSAVISQAIRKAQAAG